MPLINLWKAAGKPVAFNPFIATQTITLGAGQYVMTIRAKSSSGSSLTVDPAGDGLVNGAGYVYVALAPQSADYTLELVFKTGQSLFLIDYGTAKDIIVEDIVVKRKGLPAIPTIQNLVRQVKASGFASEGAYTTDKVLSVNKVSVNGTPLSKSSTVTVKANFDGKVAGNTDLVPHTAKFRDTAGSTMTTLTTPSLGGVEFSASSGYPNIGKLGDGYYGKYDNNYQGIVQNLFSFDLLRLMTDRFGTEFFADSPTLADKVNKLKTVLSKITANWHGFGSTVLSNPSGKMDFTGKVAGSVTENANIAKRIQSAGATAGLHVPTSAQLLELSAGTTSVGYDTIKVLNDGQLISAVGTTGSGAQGQILFSFNLIEYVQRKYGITIPGATTADRASWLRANIKTTVFNWHGFGSSPGGTKATIAYWYGTGSRWVTAPWTHTSPSVSKLAIQFSIANDFSNGIDDTGFCHFLAYAEPSDGVTASVINTDFVELQVDMVAGSNKATLAIWENTGAWNGFPATHTNGTVTKLTNSTSTVTNKITTDGFVHFLAYADPSNGLSPSVINTDYIELEVDVNASEAGYDVWTEGVAGVPKLSENLLPASIANPVEQILTPSNANVTLGIPKKGSIEVLGASNTTNYAYLIPIEVVQGLISYASVDVENPSNTDTITVSLNIAGAGGGSITLQPKEVKRLYGSWTASVSSTASSARFYEATGKAFWLSNFKYTIGNPDPDFKNGRNKKKTLNFLGKVAGSVDGVPHKVSTTTSTTVHPVNGAKTDWDTSVQANFDQIAKQDGTSKQTTNGTIGQNMGHLFEFDLSHLGLSLADLKSALRKLTATWVGYGKGDNAGVASFGATLKIWNKNSSAWDVWGSNTVSAPTALSQYSATANSAIDKTTDDQKVYILVHSTYPAGAASSSEIYTDYVKLDVELADWVDYVPTNAVKVKQSDPTKVKLMSPSAKATVDVEYTKADTRLKPGKNLVPTSVDAWEQGSINGTGGSLTDTASIRMKDFTYIDPSKTYVFSRDTSLVNSGVVGHFWGMLGNYVGYLSLTSGQAFTPPAGSYKFKVRMTKASGTFSPLEVQQAKPMLVEGTVPAPFEDYQLTGGMKNVPSALLVPRKNLIDKNAIVPTAGKAALATHYLPLRLKPNTAYTVKSGIDKKGDTGNYNYYGWIDKDINSNYTGAKVFHWSMGTGYTSTFTTDSVGIYYLLVYKSGSVTIEPKDVMVDLQLEEGSAATAFEDYKLALPKSSQGTKMDGATNYLQLPSMTMDAIEIDCLIDSVQPQAYPYIFDARPGMANGYFYTSNVAGSDVQKMFVNDVEKPTKTGTDVPKNQRVKLTFTMSQFTDDVNIFSASGANATTRLRGILYGVKCLLNGQVVREYDLTDPRAISGNKVYPKGLSSVVLTDDGSSKATAARSGADAQAATLFGKATTGLKPVKELKYRRR